VRGAKARVNGGEEARGSRPSRAIAKQDAGLAEHHHQQHAGDAGDGSERDDEGRDRKAQARERLGDRGVDVDGVYGTIPVSTPATAM